MHTAWDKVEDEDNALRPLGDNRPFIARFELPEARGKPGLVVFRDDQIKEVWTAIGIENGWL